MMAALLAAMGGGLAALGQVPWSLWPLALAGYVLILHLAATAPDARGAARRVLAAGMAHFALAMNWIVEPFLVEPEVYGWMAPFALVLMALGGGLFWAVPVWAVRRLGLPKLPGVVLALVVADLMRGHLFTGFPWALVGHVWIGTPVTQGVAVVGAYGLGLATLVLAALLAHAGVTLVAGHWRRGGLAALAALALLGAGWGHGVARLSAPDPEAKGPMLRLVQPNAAQEGKWDPALAEANYAVLLEETAAAPPVDLVIWPETALPWLLEEGSLLPEEIARAAGGASVMLGLQRLEVTEDGRRGFNSLRVQDAQGREAALYDKHHLVPFGEYIPFGDLAYDAFGIGAFAARLGQAYSAGPGPRVLDLGPDLGRVLPLICYEAVFPQDLRRAPERADWLVQVTNDAWFGTRSGPFQHAALARLRAIEVGLPLVRVANTGVTQVVDARGRVVAGLPLGTRGHLDAPLPGALPVPPPYARWGEVPLLVLLASAFAALLAQRRRPAA